jgi:hypothetical protein
MKPSIFIGSSSQEKSLDIANALQELLEKFSAPTVWDQGVAELSKTILDSLLKRLNTSQFGAFIFSDDDVITVNGQTSPAVRDSVLFELGLFMGRLGPERTAIVTPKSLPQPLRVPSDLLGLTSATFDSKRPDLVAALGSVRNKIQRSLKNEGLLDQGPPQPPEVLSQLDQLSKWVLDHKEGKYIRDWNFELHFHDPAKKTSGKLDLEGFSIYEVKKCRYNLLLSEKPYSIGLTVSNIAARKLWKDNPAYLHQIYISALKSSEKQAITKVFDEKSSDPLAAWEFFFENDWIKVSEVGKNKWYDLKRADPECGDRHVVAYYHLPDEAKELIGKEVTLDLGFKSLRPNSLDEFTLEFPWLTLGCDAQLIVRGENEYLVQSPRIFAKTSPTVEVEENYKTIITTSNIVLPGSSVHIRWCPKS